MFVHLALSCKAQQTQLALVRSRISGEKRNAGAMDSDSVLLKEHLTGELKVADAVEGVLHADVVIVLRQGLESCHAVDAGHGGP